MAVQIAAAGADEHGGGPQAQQERHRTGRAAAVMRRLQHDGRQQVHRVGETGLHGARDVARQQHATPGRTGPRAPASRRSSHAAVPSPAAVDGGRAVRPRQSASDRRAAASASRCDGHGPRPAARPPRLVARDRHAHPHLAGREVAHNRRGAADMIRVAVRHGHVVHAGPGPARAAPARGHGRRCRSRRASTRRRRQRAGSARPGRSRETRLPAPRPWPSRAGASRTRRGRRSCGATAIHSHRLAATRPSASGRRRPVKRGRRCPTTTIRRGRRSTRPSARATAPGTRQVAHGARSTSRLLSTSTRAAATWSASRPRPRGSTGSRASAITHADAAACTTPIAGTAARFSTSPAIVTRSKTRADTGISTSSTARLPRQIAAAACHHAAGRAGSHRAPAASSAPVAPKVSQKPGVDDVEGIGEQHERRANADGVDRGGALIDDSQGEIDDRRQRGPHHRRAAADHPAVRDQHDEGDRGTGREPQPDRPQHREHGGRQQRDVAAGDGHHVVGAGLLQPQFDLPASSARDRR